MTDLLINLIKKRIVQVSSPATVGTGGFIAPGIILTCAHVVRQSMLPDREAPITIYYNSTSDKNLNFVKKGSGKVLYVSPYRPINSEDTTKEEIEDEYPDIAIVQLIQLESTSETDQVGLSLKQPVVLTDHLCFLLPDLKNYSLNDEENRFEEHRKYGAEYIAYGFQRMDMDTYKQVPETISLSYEGESDISSTYRLTFKNGIIKGGMSGAPLIDRETGSFVGIVQRSRSTKDDSGAYVIPLAKILKYLKIWEGQSLAPKKGMDVQSSGKVDSASSTEKDSTTPASTPPKGFINHDRPLNPLLQNPKVRNKIVKSYESDIPRFPFIKKNWKKLLLLSGIVLGAILWINTHWGALEFEGLIGLIIIAGSFVLSLLSGYLDEAAGLEIIESKKVIGNHFFRYPVLFFSAIILLLLWCFTGSVWILGSADNEHVGIDLLLENSINPFDAGEFDNEGDFRKTFFIGPLGKDIIVRPKYKAGRAISIIPFWPEKLNYKNDFEDAPILLVRFPQEIIENQWLGDFELIIEEEDKGIIYEDKDLEGKGAILFGPRQFLFTDDLKKEWLAQYPSQDTTQQKWNEEVFYRWTHPDRLPNFPLDTSMKLHIYFNHIPTGDKYSDFFKIKNGNNQPVFK